MSTAFHQQIPEQLDIWVKRLHEGYSIRQVVHIITEEAPQPTAGMMKWVIEEIEAGIPVREALNNLLLRFPGEDLDLLITAIDVQADESSTLADRLDFINRIIRKRRDRALVWI